MSVEKPQQSVSKPAISGTLAYLFAVRGFAAGHSSEKLLLFYLISRADDKGRCFPSLALMMHELGFSKRSVERLLASLEHKHVLSRRKQGKNNEYQLHLDAIKARQVPPMTPMNREQVPPVSPITVGQVPPVSQTGAIGDAIGATHVADRCHHGTRKNTNKKTKEENIEEAPKKFVSSGSASGNRQSDTQHDGDSSSSTEAAPLIPIEPCRFLEEWRNPPYTKPNGDAGNHARNCIAMALEILKSIARRQTATCGAPEVMVHADAVMQSDIEWLPVDGHVWEPKQIFNTALGHLRESGDIRVSGGYIFRLPYVAPKPRQPRPTEAPAPVPRTPKTPTPEYLGEKARVDRLRNAAARALGLWNIWKKDDYSCVYCTACDHGKPLPSGTETCPNCGAEGATDTQEGVELAEVWVESLKDAYILARQQMERSGK